MSELFKSLAKIDTSETVPENKIVEQIIKCINDSGYTFNDINVNKPWGAYFRFGEQDEEKFIHEFFPGVNPAQSTLGKGGRLNIKILLADPGQGLSWQYHRRRSEAWTFITEGAYKRSMKNQEGDLQKANAGDIVQFKPLERHRLIGCTNAYTIVAEIWQHTDPDNPSDENDIVRLIDDYSRVSKKELFLAQASDFISNHLSAFK